jgi:hypothetical protein
MFQQIVQKTQFVAFFRRSVARSYGTRAANLDLASGMDEIFHATRAYAIKALVIALLDSSHCYRVTDDVWATRLKVGGRIIRESQGDSAVARIRRKPSELTF